MLPGARGSRKLMYSEPLLSTNSGPEVVMRVKFSLVIFCIACRMAFAQNTPPNYTVTDLGVLPGASLSARFVVW